MDRSKVPARRRDAALDSWPLHMSSISAIMRAAISSAVSFRAGAVVAAGALANGFLPPLEPCVRGGGEAEAGAPPPNGLDACLDTSARGGGGAGGGGAGGPPPKGFCLDTSGFELCRAGATAGAEAPKGLAATAGAEAPKGLAAAEGAGLPKGLAAAA